MCGRYALTANSEQIQQAFKLTDVPQNLAPRFNIAPSQPVAVVVADNSGRHFDVFRWGLIPFWAKDARIGNRLINARAETLAEKASFKHAFKRRRCLILADGFFEWQKLPQGKQPVFIHLKNRAPFGMAGLWEHWQSPGGDDIYSCTIITTTPNELLAPVHNRMPVILPPEAHAKWLAPDVQTPAAVQPLLRPFPADAMAFYPVSTTVNSPANDDPTCIEPI